MALTPKQEAFCIAYLTSRDVKASALEAGYSESYATKKAYQLLHNEEIKAFIEEAEKEYFSGHFAKLAFKAMGTLEEILDDPYDSRSRLAAIKEIFTYFGLERKLGMADNDSDESSHQNISIVFNEVPSRQRKEISHED
jgi:hypothetical protein